MTNDLQTKTEQADRGSQMLALVERAMMSPDIDVEKMRQILEMQTEWEAREARKAYDRAMTQFRANCPRIFRTRSGHNSKYAGLAETVDQIRDTLSEYGLSVSWGLSEGDGKIRVTCIVSHVDGHQESTSLPGPADDSGKKNALQAIGSTVAYLERYTMFAILGLAAEDMDDDGAAAGRTETVTAQQAAKLDEIASKVQGGQQRLGNYLRQRFGSADPANVPANAYASVLATLERNANQETNR